MEKNNSGVKIFGILTLTVVAFAIGVVFGRNVSAENGSNLLTNVFNTQKDVDMGLFWEVWGTMKSKYVDKDKVTDQDMMYGSIKGMVNSYEDPATIFLTPEETEEFNKSNEGKYFEGIGAELGYEDGYIIIVSPIDGSPAKAAGVRAGDYILAVDDTEVKRGDNIYDIVALIRGESGTTVKLKVLHKGENEPVEIDIKRGEITVPSMTLSFVGNNKDIALVDIARFTDSSYIAWANRWDEVTKEIKSKGVNKVIVDLRGNPGGYFDAAIYAADDFLDSNLIISKQEDGEGNVQEYKSSKGGELVNSKLIVLVDSGSASASEILSGALQQNNRAKVIGTKTYGKGTAQTIQNLSDGSSLHVTVLKWLLPNGEWLNRDNPITPDIEVELTNDDFMKGLDPQMDRALEEVNKL